MTRAPSAGTAALFPPDTQFGDASGWHVGQALLDRHEQQTTLRGKGGLDWLLLFKAARIRLGPGSRRGRPGKAGKGRGQSGQGGQSDSGRNVAVHRRWASSSAPLTRQSGSMAAIRIAALGPRWKTRPISGRCAHSLDLTGR